MQVHLSFRVLKPEWPPVMECPRCELFMSAPGSLSPKPPGLVCTLVLGGTLIRRYVGATNYKKLDGHNMQVHLVSVLQNQGFRVMNAPNDGMRLSLVWLLVTFFGKRLGSLLAPVCGIAGNRGCWWPPIYKTRRPSTWGTFSFV
ncbi:hypothetical protein AVEN_130539-1 [Araneus ventricosus]|uniref:Uncharacterized protein n=1 Tax=Araneus ventricosus TaxID=182803 RepID=A0A4Y2J4M8_ARAVE|nr:hypothetical protein AVEN_130539-1 [Araneus ventricosus]